MTSNVFQYLEAPLMTEQDIFKLKRVSSELVRKMISSGLNGNGNLRKYSKSDRQRLTNR